MAENAPNLTDALLNLNLIPRSTSARNNDSSAEKLGVIQSYATPSITSSSSTVSSTVTALTGTSNSVSETSQTSSTSTTSSPPRKTTTPPNVQNSSTADTANLSSVTHSQAAQNSQTQAQGESGPTTSNGNSASSIDIQSTSVVSADYPSSDTSSTGGFTSSSSMTQTISAPSSNSMSVNPGSGNSQLAAGASPNRNNLPIILGSILGPIALILLLSLLLFLRQRRRRTNEIATLKWETVHEYTDDTPPQSPMSSDSGHGLIQTRMVFSNLDSHVRLHWTDHTHTTRPVSESLTPAQVDSRGSSPGAVSTVSTASTITFARPVISTNTQGTPSSRNMVPSTGHYMPSGSEDYHSLYFGDESRSRKMRPW